MSTKLAQIEKGDEIFCEFWHHMKGGGGTCFDLTEM